MTGNNILTILQANEDLSEVVNLGATTDPTVLTSNNPFTGSYLFIGVQSDKVLSVEEQEIAAIYPNPFKNALNISTKEEKIYRMKVYDTKGIVLHEGTLNGSKTLNTSSYPSGGYFLVFYSSSGNVVTKVIKH